GRRDQSSSSAHPPEASSSPFNCGRKHMPPTKTFQISPGGNQVVQGQPVILDGKATGGSATGLKGLNVFLNGFAPGSWASGDDFEFSPFIDTGLKPPASVTLNAAFVNVSAEVVSTATLGVNTINLKLGEHDVTIEGGLVTPFGGGSPVANFSGLKTLSLMQSAG